MNGEKNPMEINKKLTCEVCGNTYDKSFEVNMGGESHVFDCFECAIHALAPTCAHCACRIIGHGMEADGVFYCCAHCASQHGIHELEDRVEERNPA
jgi:hypothetical protein